MMVTHLKESALGEHFLKSIAFLGEEVAAGTVSRSSIAGFRQMLHPLDTGLGFRNGCRASSKLCLRQNVSQIEGCERKVAGIFGRGGSYFAQLALQLKDPGADDARIDA